MPPYCCSGDGIAGRRGVKKGGVGGVEKRGGDGNKEQRGEFLRPNEEMVR